MKLLLVTGAGASRNLGLNNPMPLMPDWSDALCQALDHQESGLAKACHLVTGLSGPEFEKNLGELLRWEQVRRLEERFEDLGGPNPGSHFNAVVDARNHTSRRMRLVMEAINASLFDQFSQRQIDQAGAMEAYRKLLEQLENPELIVATTNYDRAAETALQMLGFEVDTGFRQRPNWTPTLEPAGLVSDETTGIPVLHLHGAVGWYEKEGHVGDHMANMPYTPSLGTPVVLYPDPDKDVTNDALVSQLWQEFDRAIEQCDAILVMGHSLHDPALVKALNDVPTSKPLVVTVFDPKDAKAVKGKIQRTLVVEMSFGPDLETSTDLRGLLERGSQPVDLELH